MNRFLILFAFSLLSFGAFAQKSYLVHLTIDKIILGKDSVVYKSGKTFLVEIKDKSDTIEVGKPGGIPVAIVVNVRHILSGGQDKYQLGYAFFKKIGDKWELIRHFGYTDRNDLLAPPEDLGKGKRKQAREEYNCQYGSPQQFAAYFRMDVYKK